MPSKRIAKVSKRRNRKVSKRVSRNVKRSIRSKRVVRKSSRKRSGKRRNARFGMTEIELQLQKARAELAQLEKDCDKSVFEEKKRSVDRLLILINQEKVKQAEIESANCVANFINAYNSSSPLCKEAIKKKICNQ
jgi:hypothetical protein